MKRTLKQTGRQVRIVIDNYTEATGWSAGASIDGTIAPFEVVAERPALAFRQLVERLEASDLLDDRAVPVPEKDKALLLNLLAGISETWGHDKVPDWRENEYIRGQLELVIETCRVVTDEEWDEGNADSEVLHDRVTDWINQGVWK
jgi:hypothetical protein